MNLKVDKVCIKLLDTYSTKVAHTSNLKLKNRFFNWFKQFISIIKPKNSLFTA